MKALLLRHRHLAAVILLLVVLAAVWFFESDKGHGWRVDLWSHASDVHDLLGDAPPWAYFTATGILPLLGIPMISFYLLTASIYSPLVAILGTAYAIVLNLLLSYAIGRLGHRGITALIARTGHTIPRIPPKHHIWMTAAVRVTPGAPLLVQNYLLVLAGVPLLTFVLISLPLELLIAAGYVLIGRSLFTGNWKLLLLAVAIVAVAIVVFRTLRKRSEMRSKKLEATAPVEAAATPGGGVASPPDLAAPGGDVVLPKNAAALPENDTASPENDAASPENNVLSPESDAASPESDAASR